MPHWLAPRALAADGNHRQRLGRGDDLLEPRQAHWCMARVRGGREHRPYNKIVSPFRPCGFRFGQVVNRLADPPQRIERAGGADGQAAVTELDAGRWNRQGDVQTVIHK